uniref:Uncharacterized protein n=1 Tax=Magallana gigas TaxID=29159 RepID=A0A8W8IEZ7_MAGGI
MPFAYIDETSGPDMQLNRGLLFHLNHLHLTEVLMSDSATSKICQWNVSRPMEMDPKPLKEWNLGRPKISAEGELRYRERKQLDQL